MQHLITLQQIRDQHPCREGWTTLLKSLGNPEDLSVQVSFGDIAKSNGAADALWCACCVDDRRFVVSMIMSAVKRASKHTSDQRVHDCIAALERWLAGDGSVDLLAAARAAYAAADAAAYAARAAYAAADAAAYAAYAAAAAAAADADAAAAADAAARAARAARAAYTATRAVSAAEAERQQQIEDIIAVSPLYALK